MPTNEGRDEKADAGAIGENADCTGAGEGVVGQAGSEGTWERKLALIVDLGDGAGAGLGRVADPAVD